MNNPTTARTIAETYAALIVNQDTDTRSADGQVWPVWIAPAKDGFPNYHLKNQPAGFMPSANTYVEVRKYLADWIEKAIITATQPPQGPFPEEYYCDQCPHARHLHNPDGSCPCGVNCAVRRENQRVEPRNIGP